MAPMRARLEFAFDVGVSAVENLVVVCPVPPSINNERVGELSN